MTIRQITIRIALVGGIVVILIWLGRHLIESESPYAPIFLLLIPPMAWLIPVWLRFWKMLD